MRPRLALGPSGPKPRRPGGVDLKAHLVTTGLLVAVVAIIALLWAHPILLLYLFLAVVAVMAYAAVYLVVSARLAEDEEIEGPPVAGTRPDTEEGKTDAHRSQPGDDDGDDDPEDPAA